MSTSFVRVGGVARMALWVCLGLLAVSDAPGATRWGLLVGINQYAPGYASSLNCCVNDAEGMRDTVMLGDAAGRWPSANIQLLTNSQATKASIRSALQTLAAQAGAGDVVIYYHSSHGGQYVGTSTYICSYNTEYSDTELGADLALFDSSVSVVVILDTCHSAGMFKSRSWAFAENAMASFRAEKARQFAAAGLAVPKALGGNIGFMTACDYNELSWESPPHGFFTGAILRACDDASVDANGDGELQFMELHNYAAAETVEDQTAQHLNAALLEGIPALAAPGGSGISDDEYEENDIRATAFDLSLHEQTWLSAIDGLGVQADDDWFKITVAPGYLRVLVDCEFTHADGNIDIALVDSTGSSLATSEGSGDVENIDFVVPESGVYYIRVHQGNAGNTYDLRWRDALDDSKPDLVIESIAHSPANPVANDVVTFTVTVRNQGQGAAAAVFNVAFWPDRASAPTISTASALSKDYNLGIAPGQAATLQFAATAYLAVDTGDIELIAIARAALGQGHGLLGLLQQFLGAVAVFGEQGDTDGGAQADLFVVEGELGFQVIEDALCQLGGFVGLLDIGLDQGELVAAQARQGAEAPTVGTQAVGQGQQQLVAGLVGVLLVDALEVIQPHA